MIKTIKILGVAFLIGFGFFISSYTNNHDIRDISKEFSSAQESLSKLINTFTSNQTGNSPVSLALTSSTLPLGENIILHYDGATESFKDLSFDLTDSRDQDVFIKESLNENKYLQIETSKKIGPGRYKLMIKQGQKELINSYIYFGTIVINNQQFQYVIGENYSSHMALFDDNGKLICENMPNFTMINTLSGINDTIQTDTVNCDEKNPTPYRLSYVPKLTGTYILKNPHEETNTPFIETSAFSVSDTAPTIVVKREGPLFVISGTEYEVKITILARENFEGVLTDLVPAGFKVSNTNSFSLQAPIVLLDESTIHLRRPFNGDFPVTLKFSEGSDDPTISNGYKNFGIKAHDGIDFALPENTPVFAADDGTVIEFPTKLSAYGNTIVLAHQWGGRTFYGHLSKINVKMGQKVGKGDIIGFSGHTGLVTGPHLHFGLDLKDSDVNNGYLGKIDPIGYISENNNLNVSIQKLSWDVSLNKGEKKELGYVFKIPTDDYGYPYFELGPTNMVNKNGEVIFKDSQKWTLIKQ